MIFQGGKEEEGFKNITTCGHQMIKRTYRWKSILQEELLFYNKI